MATKKVKVATKGAKQIVEENASTLNFYRNMIFGAVAIHLTLTFLLFEYTTLTFILSVLFSKLVFFASYHFMKYMARVTYSETGQIIDSGVDLNMEGGIAEHVKDLIILTAGVLLLSLISNYFWLLWLLVPLRAGWMLWVQILYPWFSSQSEEKLEVNEKKQRKMEKKLARRH